MCNKLTTLLVLILGDNAGLYSISTSSQQEELQNLLVLFMCLYMLKKKKYCMLTNLQNILES